LCWGIVRVARGGDDDDDGENASTDDDVTVNIAAMTCSDFFMMIGIERIMLVATRRGGAYLLW
jgi:hypothetical protein